MKNLIFIQNMTEKNNNHGGKRNGAGRIKGKVSALTKLRTKKKQLMEKRIIKSIDALLNAQMTIAQGVQMLFKIEKAADAKGNIKRSKPILVTDQKEIAEYLEGKFKKSTTEFYFMTAEKPDNKALDSLINRAFGKPKESLDITTQDQKVDGIVYLVPGSQNEDPTEANT